MYTDSFDALKAKRRALTAIRERNEAARRSTRGRLGRFLPNLFARPEPMTALQECLVVHMHCAAPHTALE